MVTDLAQGIMDPQEFMDSTSIGNLNSGIASVVLACGCRQQLCLLHLRQLRNPGSWDFRQQQRSEWRRHCWHCDWGGGWCGNHCCTRWPPSQAQQLPLSTASHWPTGKLDKVRFCDVKHVLCMAAQQHLPSVPMLHSQAPDFLFVCRALCAVSRSRQPPLSRV